MIGAVSEAEVVTAAASEGAEEATGEETVEDTALERWTQGVTTDRSGGAVRTRSSVIGQPSSTLRPAQTFTFYITLLTLIHLIQCVDNVIILWFVFALVHVTHFVHVYPHSLLAQWGLI